MHPSECPHGGYNEMLDMNVGQWATLARLCWGSPSSFRMGWEAEARGISGNPYKSSFSRGVFEAGRRKCRELGFSFMRPFPDLPPNVEVSGRL